MDTEDLQDWLLAEGDARPRTVRDTMSVVRRLSEHGVDWARFRSGVKEAKREVRGFLAALELAGKRHMKRNTEKALNRVARYLGDVQGGVWTYYKRRGPWELSTAPKRAFDPYTDEELARIAAYTYPSAFIQARRRAIVYFLSFLGERKSQVHRLQVGDLDPGRRAVRVMDPVKEGEPRWENAPDSLFSPSGDVAAWLLQRARVAGPSGPVWVTVDGAPLGLDGFGNEIFAMRKELGIPLNHNRFRHTKGLHAYRAGLPVQVQQDEWGHSDPKSTLWYMRGSVEDRRRILESSGMPGWN